MTTTYRLDADGIPLDGSPWYDPLPSATGVVTIQQLAWIALLSDRQAEPGDLIPDGTTDRRGWWADAFDGGGDRFGSRLWLLAAGKLTNETAKLAQDYAAEALEVLVEDGVCARVEAEAERQGNAIVIAATVYRDDDSAPERIEFPGLWDALTEAADG